MAYPILLSRMNISIRITEGHPRCLQAFECRSPPASRPTMVISDPPCSCRYLPPFKACLIRRPWDVVARVVPSSRGTQSGGRRHGSSSSGGRVGRRCCLLACRLPHGWRRHDMGSRRHLAGGGVFLERPAVNGWRRPSVDRGVIWSRSIRSPAIRRPLAASFASVRRHGMLVCLGGAMASGGIGGARSLPW
jgi:hypothetical protein